MPCLRSRLYVPLSAFTQDVIEPDVREAIALPTEELLSDEPPMETYFHLRQMILLLTSLEWHWRDRNDFFAAGNLTIYYSRRQRKSEEFRGPDFFVVLNTERKPRDSWVVWQENDKYPNVIVEILSDSTAETDRVLKKQIYQDNFRTPDYFWFDPKILEFRGFHLVGGEYQELQPNENGWLWSQQLGLYLGIYQSQLRFFTSQGQLVPTLEEKTEQESQRAEQEKQRAETLAQKLRDLGIDPSNHLGRMSCEPIRQNVFIQRLSERHQSSFIYNFS
jgi:Uma2 family endonuclease